MSPEELRELADRLNTQDTRITQDPLYQVQQRHVVWGLDEDHADAWRWHREGLERPVTLEEALADEHAHTADLLGERGWSRIGIRTEWEFVTAHFTEHAANEYIRENAHNLTEPRVYVSSQYRCHEWNAVVAMLKGMV